MKTTTKIAAGLIAALVAGVLFLGTAVAAPRMVAAPAFGGYGMMRSLNTSGTFEVPTFAEMRTFMNRYRTAGGSIDVTRMRADVASGRVTPPCLDGAAGAKTGSTTAPNAQSSSPRGRGMMRGLTQGSASSTGYGMMGSFN
jgi:hypothetical protein